MFAGGLTRVVLAAVAMTFTAARAHAAARPNVIVIVADDMGFSDVGCYGGEVQTPNVDKLAAEGTRVTQFYNMARCCPTRASLLTGLYPHQAGMGAMNQDLGSPAYRGELNDRCVTIAEVLGQAGYQTGMVGKWHLSHLTVSPGNKPAADKPILNYEVDAPVSPAESMGSWPINRGFGEMWGTIAGVGSFYNPWGFVHDRTPVRPPEGFYYTDFITQKSLEVIGRSAAAADPKPFFMYVAYTAPHWPIQAHEETIKKYEPVYRKGWEKVRQERYERLVKMGIIKAEWEMAPRETDQPRHDPVIAWDEAKHPDWQARRMATYAAMIDEMDQGIGKITAKLDELGIADNTMVIFLSDNGACAENVQPGWYDVPSKTRDGRAIHVGNDDPTVMPGPEETFESYGPLWANVSNTPFRSFKHYTHEGGISAPLVVRWPGHVRKGAIESYAVGDVIDVLPTCLDAAGVEYPATYKGREVLPAVGMSLLPVLGGDGTATLPDRALFWEHEGNRAVRAGDWKLVAAHGHPWQLFNMAADRTELHDLAGDQPARVRDMLALYDSWAARCGVLPWPVKAKPAAAGGVR
jgi:arylsulfatase A-like enzyme